LTAADRSREFYNIPMMAGLPWAPGSAPAAARGGLRSWAGRPCLARPFRRAVMASAIGGGQHMGAVFGMGSQPFPGLGEADAGLLDIVIGRVLGLLQHGLGPGPIEGGRGDIVFGVILPVHDRTPRVTLQR